MWINLSEQILLPNLPLNLLPSMMISFAKVYIVCSFFFSLFDAVFIYEVFLEHSSFVLNDNLMIFN